MTRRQALVAVSAIVALNLFVLLGAWLDDSEVTRGPAGSSYVTTPEGVAAWYELLVDTGTAVRRIRTPVDDDVLSELRAFVVVEPGIAGYGAEEVAALRRFAETGGTLVVAGRVPPDLLDALVGFDPGWKPPGAGQLRPWGAPPGGPTRVEADGFGSWTEPGKALPVLGADLPAALAVSVGRGTVHLLADASVVTNAHLGEEGNARYAVAVVGPGPVGFDEYRHGFTDGATALPPAWRRTWPLLAVVVLAGLYAAGRRLVPPQETTRSLGPERSRYVESLAALLVRSGGSTAVLPPLRDDARRLVADQAGLDADADPGRIAEAARRLGLHRRAVEAIMGEDADEATLETVARAHALLRAKAGESR